MYSIKAELILQPNSVNMHVCIYNQLNKLNMLKNCSPLREAILPNNKNCSHDCSSCDDYDRRNDTGMQPDLRRFKCLLSDFIANMTELSCINF